MRDRTHQPSSKRGACEPQRSKYSTTGRQRLSPLKVFRVALADRKGPSIASAYTGARSPRATNLPTNQNIPSSSLNLTAFRRRRKPPILKNGCPLKRQCSWRSSGIPSGRRVSGSATPRNCEHPLGRVRNATGGSGTWSEYYEEPFR